MSDWFDEAQDGYGDMRVDAFRRAAHEAVDCVADYLEGVGDYPVVPPIEAGAVRAQIAESAPEDAEDWPTLLADYRRFVEPNVTHWQHPGFLAYFSSVATGPAILGEILAAGLNANVMFWQNAPAPTEVEERVVSWLRQLVGLPEDFDGMLTDTASVSTLTALVAARHALPGLEARERGLAGRDGLSRLRLYCSEQAHTSVEKAAIVIGVGQDGVRKIPTDGDYQMDAEALALALAQDCLRGELPVAVVATLGTTSTTSIDPVARIAELCREHRVWLHVDAAYAGAAALLPEKRALLAGWERADSIVINPHKWLFTPLDASLLLFREPQTFRDAFSLVGDYMRTPERDGVHNFNEYGIQLGRRFRALKIWFLLRYFGRRGIARRIADHCAMAQEWAARVDASLDWERVAPVPFSTVCFRHAASGCSPEEQDQMNREILERVNRSGEVYLSATTLRGRVVLRVSIGNPRTERRHLERCWELLVQAATAPSMGVST